MVETLVETRHKCSHTYIEERQQNSASQTALSLAKFQPEIKQKHC